ncbi:MAG: hypothetical protein QOK28_705 [Actinomycetota bacterium]|jgi:hypothetical protein
MQSRLPTVVIAVAIVLALIGIGGVAFGAADKPSHDAASNGSTTTTEFVGDGGDAGGSGSTQSTLTTLAGATTTTAKAGAAPTTTAAAKPSAACPDPPATNADPGGNQPPAVGRYTYVNCADSSDTVETSITAGNSGNGITRRNVNGDSGGQEQTSSIAYGPAGVTVESLAFDTPQGHMTCDLNPDLENYPADMHVGAQWSGSSSCDIKNSKGVKFGTIKIDAAGKVTGKVAATVGSTTVNAWAVEGTITLTFDIPSFGSQTTHIIERGYYDAAHGIEVYRHTEATSSGGGQSVVRDEKLTSLTPKAS